MTVRSVSAVVGRRPGDHVGATYRDTAELVELAVPFLAEGLARNARVAWVGGDAHDEILAGLAGVVAVGRAVDDGRIVMIPASDLPAPDPERWPEEAVDVVRALTVAAVADGLTGLRVVSDNTAQITGPDARSAYLRAEHLVDRLCRDLPYTALCAYDATRLGAGAADAFAGAHTLIHRPATQIQLCADAVGHLALAGSIDAFNVDTLAELLHAAIRPPAPDPVVIDVGDLDFTSHHGLLTLDEHARRCGTTIELHHHRPGLARLAEPLDLDAVQLVAPRVAG